MCSRMNVSSMMVCLFCYTRNKMKKFNSNNFSNLQNLFKLVDVVVLIGCHQVSHG